MAKNLPALFEMLRSGNDQEVLTAAKMATRELELLALTWTDIGRAVANGVIPRVYQNAPRPTPPPNKPRTYSPRPAAAPIPRHAKMHGILAYQLCAYLATQGERLMDWDRNFLRSLGPATKGMALSEKQWNVVLAMGRRIGAISTAK